VSKLVFVMAAAPALLAGCATDPGREVARLTQEVADLRSVVGPPPASLDSLYPPFTSAPVFLFRMLELGEALSAVSVDVLEQDVEHARSGLDSFRAEYDAVSRLVSEWETAYPAGPVDSLAAALESGDSERIGAAFERVGTVCHECHVANMAKVHYRYRWGDFERISIDDAASGRHLTFRQLMQEMETAFTGIGVDLSQQQVANARAQFATFQVRFSMLATTCVTCHTTERKYFIDAGVLQMVQQLGALLQTDIPDATQAIELGRQIGAESCSKCHLVHAPAAMARASWVGS